MKSFIVFALFVAAAVAAPLDSDASAGIVRQEVDNIGVEGYRYAVETSNGIKAEEQGQLEGQGEDQAMSVRGAYSYIGEDGVTYTVTYVADRNGFQPSGAHIPQA